MNNLEDLKKLHKEILWTTVRVRSEEAGGSGTIVHSEEDEEGNWHSFILTCEHVVDDLIKIEKKFDPVAKVERKMEILGEATVEFFYYEDFSRCKGSSGTYKAKIKAYDKDEDIALLELEKKTAVEPIAAMFPKDEIDSIHVFDELYCAGASMGHEPIVTDGVLSFMDQRIEGKEYWMSTAQTIFGNSGGAIFRYSSDRERFEFLGMPARITVAMFGYSADAITHMGFFVPIDRIYEILDKNHYEFIYDPDYTYEECKELREKERKKEEKLLLAKYGEVED